MLLSCLFRYRSPRARQRPRQPLTLVLCLSTTSRVQKPKCIYVSNCIMKAMGKFGRTKWKGRYIVKLCGDGFSEQSFKFIRDWTRDEHPHDEPNQFWISIFSLAWLTTQKRRLELGLRNSPNPYSLSVQLSSSSFRTLTSCSPSQPMFQSRR